MIFHPARPHARLRGFTLTEILIVLVIAALLAAFGLPTLLKYGLHGNLAAAQSLLKRIAGEESAWMGNHNAYATLGQLGYPVDTAAGAIYLAKDASISGNASEDSIYRVSIRLQNHSADTGDSPYFLISAQPVNKQVGDTDCATLSLASTGQIGASGILGEADCWNK